jgi:secreted PhoX family phosphatase
MSKAPPRAGGTLTRRALLASAAFLPAAFSSACHRSRLGDGADGAPDREGLVRDPRGILDLPPDFSYRIIQEAGERMSDDFRVPGRPDGMFCVAGEGDTLVLLRNHENRDSEADIGPYFPGQDFTEHAYEREGLAGVTRVVLDAQSLELKSSNLVLAGTSWNCASGPSPWGFLSCEETVRAEHGFVFLCEWDSDRVRAPRRIDGYGRFRHEAAAVDPETSIAYLTEDQPNAGFYRFVPRDKAEPFDGVLQALTVPNRARLDTGALPVGERVDVDWIDIEQPNPVEDTVRSEAHDKGAALFQRTEGIYFAGHELFLTATTGGHAALGQVLRLDLREATLDVIAESGTPELMSGPDNVCVSPHGVLYVAEDGVGVRHLRRITLDGEVVPFARNAASFTEMAGLCFSPNGDTLFVNIQEENLTVAVRGPFEALDRELARSCVRRTAHDGLATFAQAAWRNRTIG